jgi:hypothetical protein
MKVNCDSTDSLYTRAACHARHGLLGSTQRKPQAARNPNEQTRLNFISVV